MGELTLTIMIIEENPVRAAILEAGMRDAGDERIVHIGDMVNLPAKSSAVVPAVIVTSLEIACCDALEQMFQVSRSVRRPIAATVFEHGSRPARPHARCRWLLFLGLLFLRPGSGLGRTAPRWAARIGSHGRSGRI